MRQFIPLLLVAGALSLASCTKHEIEVKPIETKHEIEVKPIHITVDVNIKIDRQLDNFFDFEKPAPAPKPAGDAPADAPKP